MSTPETSCQIDNRKDNSLLDYPDRFSSGRYVNTCRKQKIVKQKFESRVSTVTWFFTGVTAPWSRQSKVAAGVSVGIVAGFKRSSNDKSQRRGRKILPNSSTTFIICQHEVIYKHVLKVIQHPTVSVSAVLINIVGLLICPTSPFYTIIKGQVTHASMDGQPKSITPLAPSTGWVEV